MPDPSPSPRRRSRTGDPAVDSLIRQLVTALDVDNEDLATELLTGSAKLLQGTQHRGDLKIASGAVREMGTSFRRFSAFRSDRKASVFGSARTRPDEPAYRLARDVGDALAEAGWMVITGGGPGIMNAAVAGAGRTMSFAVTIRLPFEPSAASSLVDDDHLVRFKYFFTRKLTFMKESSAYVVFPGGFGTMDEVFELLTLVQTGKEPPVPIVLMEPEGGHYWETWYRFVHDELVALGLVAPEDLDLVYRTHRTDDAVAYIDEFYRTYDSMRWVDGLLVIRLKHHIGATAIGQLNDEFAELLDGGRIDSSGPLPAEVRDDDLVALPRLTMAFDRRQNALLHRFVRRLADFGPARND